MISYPHINPVAVRLGPLSIHWYGIMYLVGFAAAWWLARRRAAQPGSSWRGVDVDDFLFYAMLGVILGGVSAMCCSTACRCGVATGCIR